MGCLRRHLRSSVFCLLACVASLALAATQGAPRDSAWPKTDFSKHTVDLAEIESGGPPKDGIPAIDHPKFEPVQKADAWLDPREPVISLRIGDVARAYPLQILVYHEIVNDTLDGVPVAVTFCPLCHASLVFERRVGDQVLDFGTTGRLRKSDLVMYDRQSESWWQQITGQGIVGQYTGTRLTQLPSYIVSYQDFKTAHSAGEVLARPTEYARPYGRNPYRGYDRIDSQPFLFHDPVDARLPPMERVLTVAAGGKQRLYPLSTLRDKTVINDRVGQVAVVVLSKPGTLSVLDASNIRESSTVPSATAFNREVNGETLEFATREGGIVDTKTGSQWNIFGQATAGKLKGQRLRPVESGVHFAFAWLAFNPGAEIYAPDKRGEDSSKRR